MNLNDLQRGISPASPRHRGKELLFPGTCHVCSFCDARFSSLLPLSRKQILSSINIHSHISSYRSPQPPQHTHTGSRERERERGRDDKPPSPAQVSTSMARRSRFMILSHYPRLNCLTMWSPRREGGARLSGGQSYHECYDMLHPTLFSPHHSPYLLYSTPPPPSTHSTHLSSHNSLVK